MMANESVNEGSCGYGIDGKIGEEPAGPHLIKKNKKTTRPVFFRSILLNKRLYSLTAVYLDFRSVYI